MPDRLRLLAAKAVVLFTVVLAVAMVTTLAAFFAAQPILATQDLDVGLGDPAVLRALVGGARYLAGSAMFGFATGALVRQSAGAITGAVVLLLVLLIPGSVGDTIVK